MHIGIQLLCRHPLLSSGRRGGRRQAQEVQAAGGSVIGMVDMRCDVVDIVEEAVAETTSIVERHLDSVPDVNVGKKKDVCPCSVVCKDPSDALCIRWDHTIK